jgi:hypothetical protein
MEVRTQYLKFAVWVHEQLDWVANAIHQIDTEEYDENVRAIYSVRTVAHPGLAEIARWRDDGPPPQPDWSPATLTVRAWVAKTAAIGWSGDAQSRKTKFNVDSAGRQDWYLRLLEAAGFDVNQAGTQLELNQTESRRLFDRIGLPVPGMEHKWIFDRDEYNERRGEQWMAQQQAERTEFREGDLGRRPTAWSRKYSEREALRSLRSAADGGWITTSKYTQWRPDNGSVPSPGWFTGAGGWAIWCRLAGLECGPQPPYHSQSDVLTYYSRSDVLSAVGRAADAVDGRLTTSDYEDWRRRQSETVPAAATVYRHIDDRPWSEIVTKARDKLNE